MTMTMIVMVMVVVLVFFPRSEQGHVQVGHAALGELHVRHVRGKEARRRKLHPLHGEVLWVSFCLLQHF